MNLIKFYKLMFIITVLVLIYIHMQMQIFSLAYEGKQKEKQIIELSERNDMMEYNILKLKSSHHLGEKILNDNSELQFRDKQSVFQLSSKEWQEPRVLAEATPKSDTMDYLLSFLPFRSEAEAHIHSNRSRNSAKNYYQNNSK